jgi:hypothetical protein
MVSILIHVISYTYGIFDSATGGLWIFLFVTQANDVALGEE